jgi:hypothetical protein
MSEVKKIIFIVFCFFEIAFYSQSPKKVFVNVYLGTYLDGKIEKTELIEAPRINIFNEKGKLLSSTLFDSIGGTPQQEFTYYYDSTGTLISTKYGDGIKKPHSETKYFYNTNRLLSSTEEYYDNSKKIASKKVFIYDKNDNLIREELIIKNKTFSISEYNIKYHNDTISSIETKKFTNNQLVYHTLDTYQNSLKLTSKDFLRRWFTTYEYYPDGKEKIAKKEINGKTEFQYSFYDYDDKGNLITKAWVEESGFGEITIYSYIE